MMRRHVLALAATLACLHRPGPTGRDLRGRRLSQHRVLRQDPAARPGQCRSRRAYRVLHHRQLADRGGGLVDARPTRPAGDDDRAHPDPRPDRLQPPGGRAHRVHLRRRLSPTRCTARDADFEDSGPTAQRRAPARPRRRHLDPHQHLRGLHPQARERGEGELELGHPARAQLPARQRATRKARDRTATACPTRWTSARTPPQATGWTRRAAP